MSTLQFGIREFYNTVHKDLQLCRTQEETEAKWAGVEDGMYSTNEHCVVTM